MTLRWNASQPLEEQIRIEGTGAFAYLAKRGPSPLGLNETLQDHPGVAKAEFAVATAGDSVGASVSLVVSAKGWVEYR